MTLTPTQYHIAQILFQLPELQKYALAGGAALLIKGTVNRLTHDLDAFMEPNPANPPGDVTPAVLSVKNALEVDGWVVTVSRQHATFARLSVGRDGTSTEIDLAVDSARLFPVEVISTIPTLSTEDLAVRKIFAIVDRAEGRDFTDLQAVMTHHRQEDCIGWACQLDPGLSPTYIAAAFSNLQRLTNDELPTSDPDQTREFFQNWQLRLQQDAG